MYFKSFVAVLLASTVVLTSASPNPLPTPAPEVQQLQERQNPGDIFGSLTSAAASVITGDGASVLTQATSVLGSVASEVTSVGGSIGGQVLTQVTSVGGQALTVVTSVGGQAITLATSGAGVATSAFGSVYTVVAQNSNNAALGTRAGFSSPVVVGLAAVMGSVMLGAAITL